MADIEIKSVEYLRELQHLHDDWQEDAACVVAAGLQMRSSGCGVNYAN